MNIELLNKKELMKLTKPKLIGYVRNALLTLTQDRNWCRNKMNEYRKLYAAMVKDEKDNYVLRSDYDHVRNLNDNQTQQIRDLERLNYLLRGIAREVL